MADELKVPFKIKEEPLDIYVADGIDLKEENTNSLQSIKKEIKEDAGVSRDDFNSKVKEENVADRENPECILSFLKEEILSDNEVCDIKQEDEEVADDIIKEEFPFIEESTKTDNEMINLSPSFNPKDASNEKKKSKSLACKHCDKSFHNKFTLKRHLMVHTDEKPYICEHCDKTFKKRIYLKKHLVIHTENPLEKPSPGRPIRTVPQHRSPNDVRFDGVGHFPQYDERRLRCKFAKCGANHFSHIMCIKCKVSLCLNKNNNCFKNYHIL